MKGRRRGVREWHNSVFLLESRDRIHPQFVNYQAWIRIEERRLPAKLAWTYRQLGLITSLMNGSIERRAKEESSVEIAKSGEHRERGGGYLKVFYFYAKCERSPSMNDLTRVCRPIKAVATIVTFNHG